MLRNSRTLLSYSILPNLKNFSGRNISNKPPDNFNLDNIISEFNIKDFLADPEKFIQQDKGLVHDIPTEIAKLGLFGKLAFFSPLLVLLHQATGLPYWATIALFSSLMRIGMVPFYFTAMKEELKTQQYNEELSSIMKQKNFAFTDEEKKYFAELYKHRLDEFGIKMWKRFLVVVPISMFIPMFATMKYMAKVIPLFHTEGILWFTNLAVPDPYFILPIINSALLFFNMKLNEKLLMPKKLPGFMKWVMGASIVMSTLFTMKFNSCFFMFWIPLQLMQTVQTFGFYFYKKRWEKNFVKKAIGAEKGNDRVRIYDAFEEGLVEEEDDL